MARKTLSNMATGSYQILSGWREGASQLETGSDLPDMAAGTTDKVLKECSKASEVTLDIVGRLSTLENSLKVSSPMSRCSPEFCQKRRLLTSQLAGRLVKVFHRLFIVPNLLMSIALLSAHTHTPGYIGQRWS